VRTTTHVSRHAESAAILFDGGETLISVSGMIHSAARHIACLRRLLERQSYAT